MEQKQHHYYLAQLGVSVWQPRETDTALEGESTVAVMEQTPELAPSPTSCADQLPPNQASADLDSSMPDWEALSQQVANCQRCPLSQSRTRPVFGVGHRHADLMIVGEAPGYHEDQQGEPFVGRAGQLLNAMLASIGLQREQIYIANILKCRPPNNRDPQSMEVAQCTPYLNRQIQLLQPKLLLTVGRFAAHFLLDTKQSLSRLRNQIHRYGDQQTPLIVSYHPAYLLRNPKDKGKSYQDLLQVMKLLKQ
ncbi:MAG: uracil-DNA glycosylase [Legionellales bacterium]|nr:uracil-DNA glycosylase [Legionellales bacterium]